MIFEELNVLAQISGLTTLTVLIVAFIIGFLLPNWIKRILSIDEEIEK